MQLPWKPWNTDQRHSKGRQTIRRLSNHIHSPREAPSPSGSSLRKWTSTTDQVALWFPEILSFSTHLIVVPWLLLELSRPLKLWKDHLNWVHPLSVKKSIYQNVFLETQVLRDVHSSSLAMDRGEFNGQINLGNAVLSKDNQVPLLWESLIH